MAVQVKVDFDKGPADKAIGEVQEGAKSGFKELGKIAEESLKFEKIKAGLEGLKAFSEQLMPLLGGANSQITKTLDTSVKLGDAGFKIGSAFGPLGGVIGGVVGALGGALVSTLKASSELRASLEAITKQGQTSRDKLRDLDSITMGAVSSEIDKFRAKIKETGEEAALARSIVQGLLQEGAVGLAESFTKAAEAADKTKDAVIAVLDPIALTADQARDIINEQVENIKESKKRIEEEMFVLNRSIEGGYANEEWLKKQEKVLQKLNANIADSSAKQVEAAQALRKILDDEIAADEAAQKKKQDNYKKYRDARLKMIEADSAKLSLIAQAAIDDLEAEQKAKDDQIAQEEEWAETVKRVEYEVSLARLDSSERLKAMIAEESALRKSEADKLKADQAQAAQELADGIASALAPLGAIIGATFGQIAENIEKGNKAFKGVGLAAKGAVADVLKAFSKQWGAQALAELAAGLASLALGPVGGVAAAGHFAAAAGFGAAAAAAGLGGALVAKNVASSAPASGGSATTAPSSSGGSPFLGGAKGSSGGTVIVNMNGNLFLGSGDDRSLEEPGRNLGHALSVAASVDKRITS